MKSVLILGAGSSLAQAVSYRPSRSGAHPPLDANFFERTMALMGRTSDVASSVSSLRERLAAEPLFYDPWEAAVHGSLEQFFADVYYEVARSGSSKKSFDVYVDLLILYREVLAATTNWMAGDRRTGVVGQLLRSELKKSGDDRLTLVTFNQDLVIENAIARLPERTVGSWCLSCLYGRAGLSPMFASTSETADVFPLSGDSCRHRPRIRLLKLHGSLNWGSRSLNDRPSKSTLMPSGPSSRDVFCWPFQDVVQVRLTGAGRRPWYMWPLVIPPIYDKQRLIGSKVVSRMWDEASKTIGAADRLVLIGYSLPPADVLARQMVRRAFAQNEALTEIECVNPDPEIAQAVRSSLDARVIHVYQDLRALLDGR